MFIQLIQLRFQFLFLLYSLAEYINAMLEQDGCEIIKDLEESLPDEVTVAHAVEAWKLACQKSDDYNSKMY